MMLYVGTLALSVVSGYALVLLDSWNTLYQTLIVLHPAIATLGILWMLWHERKSIRGLLCLFLLGTGFAILFMNQQGGILWLFDWHRYGAQAFVLGSLFFFWKAQHWKQPSIRWAFAGSVLLLLSLWVFKAEPPSFQVKLSTTLLENQTPPQQDIFFSDSRFDPRSLDLTKSCTTGTGCHTFMHDTFVNSNHNLSTQTLHMQKNLQQMHHEVGEANTRTCLGCHAPSALFFKERNYAYFANHPNMSCTTCHLMSDVTIYPGNDRKAEYTVTPAVGHLDFFLNNQDPATEALTPTASMLLKLNARQHAQAFSRSLYQKDEFCLACHHHQIELPQPKGLTRPKCIECHMPTFEDVGKPGGSLKSHAFLGSNTVVPHFTNHPNAKADILEFLEGNQHLPLGGWEYVWNVQGFEKHQRTPKSIWIQMDLDYEMGPIPGQMFTFEIRSTNVGMEHAFPAGARGLAKAWLEIKIEDSLGHVIYESGVLNEQGQLDVEAHTMEGAIVDQEGKVLEHNRVWHMHQKTMNRRIDAGEQTQDVFSFEIPQNANGPFHIKAYWHYRKLHQDFVHWAYGPSTHAPYVTVGQLDRMIHLSTP